METIRIRRMATATEVNVTVKEGVHSVHWKHRVVGPNSDTIAAAIRVCRTKCAMLLDGVKEVVQ